LVEGQPTATLKRNTLTVRTYRGEDGDKMGCQHVRT